MKLKSLKTTKGSYLILLGILLSFSTYAQSSKDFSALIEHFKVTDERICNGQIIPGTKVQTLMNEAYQLEQKSGTQGSQSLYVESFYLPAGETFVLDNDLYLYSEGDVRIDGNILGKAIAQSNASGQDLIICARGSIIINGTVHLSNGGDGKNTLTGTLAMRSNTTNSLTMSIVKNHPFFKLIKNSTTTLASAIPGGNGGSLLLKAQSIIINGRIETGNGGNGFSGGQGGNGGTLVCIGEYMRNNKSFIAGNGGDGGDGISLSHPEGGQGGDGGEVLLLACTPGTAGTVGTIGTSAANATTGGTGGVGGNDTNGTACIGGVGGTGGAGRDGSDNGQIGTAGATGGQGGAGGNATNTTAGGSSTGGDGGNGGIGGKGGNGGSADSDDGGNGGTGGRGGNGGSGTGANGALVGTCSASNNGGNGTGGDGGNGGNGGIGGDQGTGSGNTSSGNGGDGGNGGSRGSGIGGNGGVCTVNSPAICGTVPGGTGTRGAAGSGGNGGDPGTESGPGSSGSIGGDGNNGGNGSSVATNGTAGSCSVLPVELTFFKGIVDNQAVVLDWSTSAELNNDKFIIEASIEGEVFNRIGEVDGAGTTTEPHDYTFTHHTPSEGTNYYRLKQVDFDGTFAYSKVIAINAPGSNDIFAFPNPTKDKITVQYDHSKGNANIQLFDALGRRLNANIGGYAGNYEIQLPLGLPKGTYWLKVERGGKMQTLPVVKE